MAKDPAVLFYTSDFLSGTFTMTDEQVGKYMRLLCIQHQKGMLTAQDMQSICKAYDEQVYSKFVKDGEFFYNVRMKNESDRRKKFSESRRKNAESTKNQTNNKPKNKKAYAKHMETETETVNETITDAGTEKKSEKIELVFPYNSTQFMQVWGVLVKEPFWKKKSKTALQAVLKKLSNYPERDAIQMMEEAIAGAWKNVYELKTQNNGNRNTGKTEYGTPERAEQYEHLFTQRYGGGGSTIG